MLTVERRLSALLATDLACTLQKDDFPPEGLLLFRPEAFPVWHRSPPPVSPQLPLPDGFSGCEDPRSGQRQPGGLSEWPPAGSFPGRDSSLLDKGPDELDELIQGPQKFDPVVRFLEYQPWTRLVMPPSPFLV